jgi:CDP-glucose 4,6-dehydratase
MLSRLGAKVTGLGLAPTTSPNLFSLAEIAEHCDSRIGDIRDLDALCRLVQAVKPEVVMHLAAQPLVRAGYQLPVETFATNVMGTVNLLEALRHLDSVRVGVIVTTDKVYENREWQWPYRESDNLGGHDPYSASKAASEIAVTSYSRAFLQARGVAVATARAGNVIGGGDWSADRLIPDAVKAWQTNAALKIRRPDSIRPWQHVIDPLNGYLVLAENLWMNPSLAESWNFAPTGETTATVREVIEIARSAWGKDAKVDVCPDAGPHEMGRLSLDASKARNQLGVSAKWDLQTSVERSIQWYRRQCDGENAHSLCLADLDAWGFPA